MRDFKKLALNSKSVIAIVPANYTGAAANGDYVSLKGYGHVTIFIITGAWAAGTAAVTLGQAKTVAGGTPIALGFTEMWTGVVDTTSDTMSRTVVAANTFNFGTADSMWMIEIDAAALTVNSGYDCVRLEVASPGANADFYAAHYLLTQGRYLQEPPLTAILD